MPVQISPKAPAPQASPVPPPPAATEPAVATVGEPLTIPNVEVAKAPIETGPVPPGAEFVVLHEIVGDFRRGDYVATADFGEGVDIERLLKLEAIKPVDAPAPQSEPAKPKK